MQQLDEIQTKQITEALIRFRSELLIAAIDLHMSSACVCYLLDNGLIATSVDYDRNKSYAITPKGYNWDVSYGEVQMPPSSVWTHDEIKTLLENDK